MIVLCGKTCSGKNAVLNALVKKGYKQLVTYTTRPKRKGEKDGITYHFISEEEFKKKVEEHFFTEYTSYHVTDHRTWYYGSHIDAAEINEDTIIILNPKGIQAISKDKNIREKTKIIYLKAENATLKKRLLARGDHPEEANRRLEEDDKDFADIDKFVDCMVNNDENSDIPSVAASIDFYHWLNH